jgi:hypothetical protein
MIMPWGRYKGKDMEDMPSSYLRWLSDNCDDNKIRKEAEDEYNFREKWNTHIWEDK